MAEAADDGLADLPGPEVHLSATRRKGRGDSCVKKSPDWGAFCSNQHVMGSPTKGLHLPCRNIPQTRMSGDRGQQDKTSTLWALESVANANN